MNDRQLDEERIFHVARAIAEPTTRAEYLDQVCAGDQALRDRVAALLHAHAAEQGLLKSADALGRTADPVSLGDASGQQIGRYRLLQKIGEGGFGVVYMAEQQRPVRRKVALKIIKPGMDSHAVVARFEAERQALAMMEHPHIARVLDGGATDNGRPYFVMELVRGVPITEYCDTNDLSTGERLRLFMTVCQAVQHAHQKGVIHRDLKPSNILVTLADGQPVVKVIDFGVSKALHQQLTEKTLFTAYGQMIGTPQYMSPEQAEMSCLDVDTRSDVYSLGVVLYELLTGSTPLDGERLRSAGYAEMQRIIREEEPPKPSTRLSTSGERLTVIAKHRGVSAESLHRIVRGDLDWIVMKALEKDRSRRYGTTTSLAEDIGRYLNNEPVLARSPSVGYRFAKFASRNRVLLATCGIMLLTLAAGISATTWFAVEANRQRDEARKSLTRLTEALIREAVTAAMGGNLQGARDLIAEAESAGASTVRCRALRGLALTYSGHPQQAIADLAANAGSDEGDFASICVLWLAALYAGDPEPLSGHMTRLMSRQPTESDDIEKLLHAHVLLYRNPEYAARRLEELVSRHATWPVVQALYGAALIQQATCSAPDEQTQVVFEKAIASCEIAYSLAPANQFVWTEYLAALTYAIELAEAFALDDQERQWRAAADRLALETDFVPQAQSQWFLAIRAYYLAKFKGHDPGPLQEELCKYSATRDAVIGASRQLAGAAGATRDEHVAGDHTRIVQAIRAILAVEQAPHDQRIALARERFEAFVNAHPSDFVWDLDEGALTIPLLAGDLTYASRAAQEMLSRTDAFSDRWSREFLKFIADPTPENEQALVQLAGPFSISQSYVHYAVAMVALARGDRPKARQYFQSVVEARKIDWGFYCWAEAFLARMQDPAWPAWIPINLAEPRSDRPTTRSSAAVEPSTYPCARDARY